LGKEGDDIINCLLILKKTIMITREKINGERKREIRKI
jgi:hypothetical protein